MKHIFSILLFFSFFALKGQGIEPSSVQPSPYLGGILKAVTPVYNEFTGETEYLYQHIDSIIIPTPLKVKDTPTMKLSIVSDTIRADIKKRLNAGAVGGSGKFVYIAFDSTGQITAVSEALDDDFDKDPFNEFQSLVIDSVGRRFTIGITDGNEVSFIDQVGVTDTTYINQLISDSISAIVFPKDSLYANGDPGHISIIGGNEVDINVNDADSNPTNELQTLSFSMPNLSIGGGNTVNLTGLINDADSNPYNELQTISIIDSTDRVFQIRLHPENQVISFRDSVGLTEMDTSLISQIISDSLSTIVFPRDSTTVLGGTGITAWESPANTWNIQNDDPDQTVTLTPAGIVSVSGAYPNFTIGATEVDGSTTNEIQTVSQSFTGTTEATYTLSNSGGSVKDTTGYMRLETMFSTPGSRTYRYKSNLGAIMGITEDPLLGGNSNIEVLRTGNQLTWGLRKDNASNGQIYKYNGTAWALSSDASGISSLNGLTPSTQTFATGTSGTDFNISSSTSTHTFNFPTASASNRGLLSSANWTDFNNKVGGSGADLRLTYWDGSANVTSSANLFWDGARINLVGHRFGDIGGVFPYASTNDFGFAAKNNLHFYTNNIASGYPSFTILANGKVGFNNAAPTDQFHVRGTGALYSAIETTSYGSSASPIEMGLKFYGGGGTYLSKIVALERQSNTGTGAIRFINNANTAMTIDGTTVQINSLAGTGNRLVLTSSTGDLSPVTLGTGLSFSGTTLNGAAPLSGTLNTIPYFNTTSTLSSMPITYSTALPAMVFPTGNAIHLVGTATIIDKNNSYGSAGEILSKASGGGVDWIPAPSFAFNAQANNSGTSYSVGTGGYLNILNAPAGVTATIAGGTDNAQWQLGLNADLAGVEGLSTTGFAFRTGTNTWVTKSIAAGDGIGVSTGGSSGSSNAEISLQAAYSQLHRTTNLSGHAFGTTPTKINFTTGIFRNGGAISTGSDILYVGLTGTYEISYSLSYYFAGSSPWNNTTVAGVHLNGSATPIYNSIKQKANQNLSVPDEFTHTFLVELTTGDELDLRLSRTSGSSTTIEILSPIFNAKYITD